MDAETAASTTMKTQHRLSIARSFSFRSVKRVTYDWKAQPGKMQSNLVRSTGFSGSFNECRPIVESLKDEKNRVGRLPGIVERS